MILAGKSPDPPVSHCCRRPTVRQDPAFGGPGRPGLLRLVLAAKSRFGTRIVARAYGSDSWDRPLSWLRSFSTFSCRNPRQALRLLRGLRRRPHLHRSRYESCDRPCLAQEGRVCIHDGGEVAHQTASFGGWELVRECFGQAVREIPGRDGTNSGLLCLGGGFHRSPRGVADGRNPGSGATGAP